MNTHPEQTPNRPRMTRAEYEKRRAQHRRMVQRKRIRAVVLFLVLIVLIIALALGIAKCSRKDPNEKIPSGTETSNTETDTDPLWTESGNDTSAVEGSDTTAATAAEKVATKPSFTADLSAYEKYMEPENTDAYLVLVNATHTLSASDVPPDLIDVVDTRKDGRQTQQMREYAEKALEALFLEAKAENVLVPAASGYPLSVMSAYRDYAKQDSYFNSYVATEMNRNASLTREAAEAIVVTYSSRAGTSEHQTGLVVDMHDLPSADRSFMQSDAYTWLSEHAWEFGFILRYPEDKTDITGISFEPWHYRYVGRYHAEKMYRSGLCLEEYLDTLS